MDRSGLNSQEVIVKKITDLKEAKKHRAKKKEISGSSSFVNLALVSDSVELPSWGKVILDKSYIIGI